MRGLAATSGLRTVALAKQVTRGDSDTRLDADGRLIRQREHLEMNPFCRRAVTHAIDWAARTGGMSRVVTMGPPVSVEVGQEALACGVDDAVLLCDAQLAGSDCLVTATALARTVVLTGAFDIVFVGHSAVDSNTAATGAMLAELLDLPFLGPARNIELIGTSESGYCARVDVQTDGQRTQYEVDLPAVIAVAERSTYPSKAPRSLWPVDPTVRRMNVSDLGDGSWGLHGSPTKVLGVKPASSQRKGIVLSATDDGSLDAVVQALADSGILQYGNGRIAEPEPELPRSSPRREREILVAVGDAVERSARAILGEAAVLAAAVGGHVTAVGSRECAAQFAVWGADQLLVPGGSDPAAVAQGLVDRDAAPPWAILATTSQWCREVAARLAVKLRSGLISDVTQLELDSAQRLRGLKPAGDGGLAEIETRGISQIMTVNTGVLAIREPRAAISEIPVLELAVSTTARARLLANVFEDDYHALDHAHVVIGVGRGVEPPHAAELETLRAVLNAEVAATRPVTDAGSLPHSRQVGVTARSVAPAVYVAIGSSGDLNHVVGFSRAGLIVAINNDPAARIFEHADIGLVGDWRTTAVRLAEQIRRRQVPDAPGTPTGAVRQRL